MHEQGQTMKWEIINEIVFDLDRLGAFRKHLLKYAEFVFLSAPHMVQSTNGEASKGSSVIQRIEDSDTSTEAIEIDDDSRSWWFNSEDRTFKGTNKNGPAYGFDDTIRAVEHAWKMLGPFHGILGFSQGASLVGLICNLSTRGSKYSHMELTIFRWKFQAFSFFSFRLISTYCSSFPQ